MPGRSTIVPAGLVSHEPYCTACASAATARSGVRKDSTDPRAALPSAAGTTNCSTNPSTARKVASTGMLVSLTAARSAAACARPVVATTGTYTTSSAWMSGRAAAARPDIHALLVVYVPVVATTGLAHAAALRAAVSETSIPVLATFLAVEGLVEQLVVPAADGSAARGSVLSFRTPERAVAALAHAVHYGSWLTSPAGTVPDLPGVDTDAARTLMARLRGPDDPPRALTDAELTTLLDCYGIGTLPYRTVGSATEALAAADRA